MSSTFRIDALKHKIEPLRQQIINHPVYAEMKTMDHLHAFMEQHVFAVWDFMSLLKTLQNELTCTRVPWFPVGNAETRYLINEIVAGEESDLDINGKRTSHFELYLEAMKQSEANTTHINALLAALQTGETLEKALYTADVSPEVSAFVRQTFSIIATGKPHIQAAVFTFGREDLIPSMFTTLVSDLTKKFPEKINLFNYYLERHIEVDGDHHSHLALEMTRTLCDTPEKWNEAEAAIIESLESRIRLWNGVQKQIAHSKQTIRSTVSI